MWKWVLSHMRRTKVRILIFFFYFFFLVMVQLSQISFSYSRISLINVVYMISRDLRSRWNLELHIIFIMAHSLVLCNQYVHAMYHHLIKTKNTKMIFPLYTEAVLSMWKDNVGNYRIKAAAYYYNFSTVDFLGEMSDHMLFQWKHIVIPRKEGVR